MRDGVADEYSGDSREVLGENLGDNIGENRSYSGEKFGQTECSSAVAAKSASK